MINEDVEQPLPDTGNDYRYSTTPDSESGADRESFS